MHKTMIDVELFVQKLKRYSPLDIVDQVICAPFPFLSYLSRELYRLPVCIGAQNVSDQLEGAFTGEVSAPMLTSLGVEYVIIGHSERRQLYKESDEWIAAKLKTAIQGKLKPFFCVGETLSEREAGLTHQVLKRQLKIGLNALSTEEMKSLVLAYEPVWAIGTGKAMTAEEAQEQVAELRQMVGTLFDAETAEFLRIQYGGSVNPGNIGDYMRQPDIDGALIGGASLSVADYMDMMMTASEVKMGL